MLALKTNNKAPIDVPTIVDNTSTVSGAQQQAQYFQQVFVKTAKDKKIFVLTDKGTLGQRGLNPGESSQKVIAIQYPDGLAAGFVLTHDKTSNHTYFIDPQGAAFELYLFIQSSTGPVIFETNTAKADAVLKSPDLTVAQWITPRKTTSQEFATLSPEVQALLEGLYADLRSPDQPATLKAALDKGPGWVFLPVITWDAQFGKSTGLINPATFALHVEENPAYTPNSTDRSILLRLPLGEFPTANKAPTAVPSATVKPTQTPKTTAAPKITPTKKTAKTTPTVVETVDTTLKTNMDAYANGEGVLPNEKLFRTTQEANSLGITDPREVGMSWGFYVQGVYLGTMDIQPKGSKDKIRIAVFGFVDLDGKHYFIPFQLGVDLNHSIIVAYDPNRTISLLDDERPITVKVIDSLDILHANMNEPVLFFLIRSAPPFPFSDSDLNYIRAHEKQYNVADQTLRFIRTAANGSIDKMQLPDYINTLNIQGKTLPLIENLILPNKP
jgi:hypothetical protein